MSGEALCLIYGLEFQCRALAPVRADADNVRFLVGTLGLKIPNQIHELELDEGTRTLSKRIYAHDAGEVWNLCSSPSDQKLLATRYSCLDGDGTQKFRATVWRRDDDNHSPSNKNDPLIPACHLADSDQRSDEITHISWSDDQVGARVMVLAENRLTLNDVNVTTDSWATPISSGRLQGKGYTRLNGGSWNPHQNCRQFATFNEHHVRGWDVRSMSQCWSVQECFSTTVRSIDFNPNKQYQLATAGDDGAVRFWDVRHPSQPVAARTDAHSHWVWSVSYNAFHDQLLLTSSSDGHVVLSCVTSISSEPHGHIIDDEDDVADQGSSFPASKPVSLEDGVVNTYEDHEDSVYVAEWSSADPWTFASLSYDGRLVLNQVPRKVKFKILNLD